MLNEYKTKKLAEFQDKFTLNKEGLELSVNATAYILKRFISDLIDEMSTNLFLKDIVTKTRIDTLKKIIENLPNKSPDRGYNDCLWEIRKDLEMELEDLTNLNKE